MCQNHSSILAQSKLYHSFPLVSVRAKSVAVMIVLCIDADRRNRAIVKKVIAPRGAFAKKKKEYKVKLSHRCSPIVMAMSAITEL